MYFENVGGIHLEAAMDLLRSGGRVAVCGQISNYNSPAPELSKINLMKMIYSQQRIEGFVSSTWLSGRKGNFLLDMAAWLSAGKLTVQETVFEGIEKWPLAFQSLFTGANIGKVVVKV
jgi:NADPH-dependent curcumin reductase CurA